MNRHEYILEEYFNEGKNPKIVEKYYNREKEKYEEYKQKMKGLNKKPLNFGTFLLVRNMVRASVPIAIAGGISTAAIIKSDRDNRQLNADIEKLYKEHRAKYPNSGPR